MKLLANKIIDLESVMFLNNVGLLDFHMNVMSGIRLVRNTKMFLYNRFLIIIKSLNGL